MYCSSKQNGMLLIDRLRVQNHTGLVCTKRLMCVLPLKDHRIAPESLKKPLVKLETEFGQACTQALLQPYQQHKYGSK
jgi:hypothetical protein